MTQPRSLTLLLVIATATLVGCGKGGFSEQQAKRRDGVFRYALGSTPTTFDPGAVQDIDYIDLISNVYEGLVAYNDKNVIEPRIAESYSTPDNGKTWIFKIRKGVKFHNGRAVTADDFSWSLDRNCSPAIASPTARDYLSDISGVQDVVDGKATHIRGVSVVDPLTLKIVLDQPRVYFIGKMTYPCAFALCKEAVGAGRIQDLKQMIGAGPFKIESYSPDQQVTLLPFKDYFGGAPKITSIERPIIVDSMTRLNKYKNGELDVLTVQRKDIPGIRQSSDLAPQLQPQPRPALFYIDLNQKAAPILKNVHVRRALEMAIDKSRIDHDLLGGLPVANGLLPPGVMGYRENYAGVPYDPAKAKEELAAAGYPGGKGFPTLELSYRSQSPDPQVACEAIEQNLKKNLGIQISVRALEWGALLQARNEGKLQLAFMSWYADYLDPQNFLSMLLSSSAKLNRDGYSNSTFDGLCAQADSISDEAQRIKLYNQAEDVAVQDAARIPMYYQVDELLVSPRVHGLRSNLFGQLPNTTVTVQ